MSNTQNIKDILSLQRTWQQEIGLAQSDGAPDSTIDSMLRQQTKMLAAVSEMEKQAALILRKFSI